MGLFEKLGLVESEPDLTVSTPSTQNADAPIASPVRVEESTDDGDAFIAEVYAAIQCDEKQDIFLLRNYLKELPNEMPDDTKVSVTKTFLSVAGFDGRGMQDNAKLRREILLSSLMQFKEKQVAAIAEHEENISQMKEMIAAAQAEIAQIRKATDDIERRVNAEAEMLQKHEDFAAVVVKAGEQN